jgi:transposase
MNVTTIGLDLAKQVFHVVGADAHGKVVLRKQLKRAQVLRYFAKLPACVVGIEACGGGHYWARELRGLGHDARLINPRFVVPYRRGEKNDYNDAAALCEAVLQPQMRFVPVKSMAQLDLQALHRLRDGLIRQRTVWINRARGLLAERGIVLARGVTAFRRALPALLEDGENGLSGLFRELLAEQYAQVVQLDERLAVYDKRLAAIAATDTACRRLQGIPGIGPVGATALVAAVGDARAFRNGRQLAAWVGLVPRQHSTGGRPRLLGISKRGDKHLRTLLIHGARAVVRHAAGKTDRLSRWIQRLQATRGTNVATVALANKLARMAWVVLSRGESYRSQTATGA